MTNFVKQKFQWFFDMSTSTTAVQNIRIVTGGDEAVKRMAPFFTAFKRFKMGKVKVRFVPAATLPVDPTGLSYEAGENTVDPRDQFNPGLVRITNGDDMVNVSADNMGAFYATMLDKRWFKFQLQSGMRRSAYPLVWNVAEIAHDAFPGSTVKVQGVTSGADGHAYVTEYMDNTTGDLKTVSPYPDLWTQAQHALIQNGRTKVGWLPTDALQVTPLSGSESVYDAGLASLPEIELMRIILPKAFKTKFYYRVFVEEEYMFKEPVAINVDADTLDASDARYQPIDHFAIGDRIIGVTGQSITPSYHQVGE